MKTVTVYTTDYCPYCTRAKNLLKQKGIAFEEIDLTSDDPKREQLESQTGCMTVPMIFIGKKFIGGCDDLYELERSGKLKSLLEA